MIYRVKQGESLDLILWHYYKAYPVAEVMLANPGLAGLGAIIPEGTIIDLPDMETASIKPAIRLWS